MKDVIAFVAFAISVVSIGFALWANGYANGHYDMLRHCL